MRKLVLAALALVACTERVPLVSAPPQREAAAPPPTEDAGASAPDAGRDGRAADGGGAVMACVSAGRALTTPVRIEYPELFIALGRSFSMYSVPLGGTNTSRIDAAKRALVPLMRAHQGALLLGYVEFPAANCERGTCCAGGFVRPSANNASTIEREMQCFSNHASCFGAPADAPAGAALASIRAWYEKAQQGGQRSVLLITDDEPSCGSERIAACESAHAEALGLYTSHRVRTHVVAVGGERARAGECLGSIARAGLTSSSTPPGHRFAADEDRLRAHVREVFAAAAAGSCRIVLENVPAFPERLVVLVEGRMVPLNTTNGWSWDGPDQATFIRFNGTYCDRLKDGSIDLDEIRVLRACMTCAGQTTRC